MTTVKSRTVKFFETALGEIVICMIIAASVAAIAFSGATYGVLYLVGMKSAVAMKVVTFVASKSSMLFGMLSGAQATVGILMEKGVYNTFKDGCTEIGRVAVIGINVSKDIKDKVVTSGGFKAKDSVNDNNLTIVKTATKTEIYEVDCSVVKSKFLRIVA